MKQLIASPIQQARANGGDKRIWRCVQLWMVGALSFLKEVQCPSAIETSLLVLCGALNADRNLATVDY